MKKKLKLTDKRDSFKPFSYPWAFDAFLQSEQMHWLHTEVPMIEDAYYLAMRMPSGFSKTSVHTMTVYIHDYIVNQSLYEWLMIVYPDGADRFWALAEDKKQKIKDASNRSAVRARIALHPF
jgi:ribonucleotide reductase beta subunit family protein with ferritin-like domain